MTKVENPYPGMVRPLKNMGKRKKKDEITVDMLDYGFIDNCTNVDDMRGIIEHLYSGKEGKYVELEQYAENKLLELLPQKESKKIIMMNTPASQTEVDHEMEELKSWMSNISEADKKLKSIRTTNNDPTSDREERDMPPIRGQQADPSKKKKKSAPKSTSAPPAPQITDGKPTNIQASAAKHTHASQYFRGWEKYDADGEVKKIEEIERQEAEAAKDAMKMHEMREQRRADKAKEELARLSGGVDFSSMSVTERTFLAQREKNKGNECFKAGEVQEALVFYSRSIVLDSNNAVVYANRALAHLREKNFEQAESDCTAALEIEPTYLKALSRRGMTRHRRGKYSLAVDDFEAALSIDPSSIELAKLLKKSKEKFAETEGDAAAGRFKRVQIMDVDGDDDSDESESEEEEESSEEESEEEDDEEDVPINMSKSGASTDSINVSGAFTASASFQGSKEGYVFKSGDEGVGYYWDSAGDPPAAKPSRIAIVEEDSEESDDDEEDVPVNVKASATRIAIEDDDDESDDDDEDVAIQKGSTRIAIVDDDSDEDDDDEEEDVDVPVNTSVTATRIAIEDDDSDEESEDEEEDVPINISTKPAPATTTRIAIEDDESDDESDDDEEGQKPTALAEALELKANGASQYKQGNIEAAMKAFVQGAATLDKSGTIMMPADETTAAVACHNNAAMCLLQLERYDEALKRCDMVLALDPANLKCRLRKGTALEKLEKWSEARAELLAVQSKVPKGDPGAGQAAAALTRVAKGAATAGKAAGTAAFKTKDLTGAVAHYTEGIAALEGATLDEEAEALRVSLHSNRAMFNLQLKDFKQALADCEKVVAAPGQESGQTSLYRKALFRRAQAQQGMGHLVDAKADLAVLVALEPSNEAAQEALKKVVEGLQQSTQQAQIPPAPPSAPAAPKPISIEEVNSTSSPVSSPSNKSPTRSPTKSPTKMDPVAMAAKAKARSKGAKVPAMPKTGYEFERVWRSLSSDPQAFCSYLLMIKGSTYKKLFKQGIEPDLALGIIQNVRERMLSADHAHALKTLAGLLKIPRFATIIGFMGDKDKAVLSDIFSQLEAGGSDPEKVASCKEQYKV